jgi:hypothetical protein
MRQKELTVSTCAKNTGKHAQPLTADASVALINSQMPKRNRTRFIALYRTALYLYPSRYI